MADLLADGLSVGVRQAADGQGYEFGATYGGVFVPLAYVKAGGLEADLQAAKQAATDAQQSQTQVTPQ